MRDKTNLKTELLPHQQRVIDRIQQQPGLVVAHGLGSGKTLTSIGAQDALQMPATVVAPAALLGNYQKEQDKHLRRKAPTKLQSLQQAALQGRVVPNPLLIVDEAHRLRDTTTKAHQAVEANKAEKRLLLTGSPFYNHPSDIAPLINVAAGAHVLPTDRAAFEKQYITQTDVNPSLWGRVVRGETGGSVAALNPQRSNELRGVFGKWVDYHPGSKENFPEVEHQTISVPMTNQQLEAYDAVLGKAPPWVTAKIRSGLPTSKQEAAQLNAFLSGVRQISNTDAPFKSQEASNSPKIQRAFDELQKVLNNNERAKAVVYSNYLEAGVNPYKQQLHAAKIPFGEFTGELSTKERNKLVEDYNANKLRVLLLSSAGGEGLDLKGTRLLQILEPHWNSEKLKQVEGRGARFKSHEGLPPEERKLLTQHYLSTRPPSGILERVGISTPGHSVDEYLHGMSQGKEKLINQFRDLLPKENAMINKTAFFTELAKIGAISDTQARASLDRLDTLERNKPTVSQVARYAGIGAAAGPLVGAVGNVIRGRAPGATGWGHVVGAAPGAKASGVLRSLAASSATGAVSSGVIPLVRSHLDRRAEIGTLREFVQQRKSAEPAFMGKVASAKHAFTVSQYAGPMGSAPFQQASQIPPFKAQGLRTAIEKTNQKIAAPRSGKLPEIFRKERGIERIGQLLSGERSLALKTYKDRYAGEVGRLANKIKAHETTGSPSDYVSALKRDHEITGRAAARVGKIHKAEATKSTAARVGVVGAGAATGAAAGYAAGSSKEAALTPAGRLVSTQRKGTGLGAAVTGPSIASVAKPPRIGHAMPGALKNQI